MSILIAKWSNIRPCVDETATSLFSIAAYFLKYGRAVVVSIDRAKSLYTARSRYFKDKSSPRLGLNSLCFLKKEHY